MPANISITIKGDLNLIDDLKKLTKEIRPGIEAELDIHLNKSINNLKAQLKRFLNEIKVDAVPDNAEQLQKDVIKIPKADKEIIEHLTGIDITKIRDHQSLTKISDMGVSVINDRRSFAKLTGRTAETSSMTPGLSIRMQAGELSTFNAQLALARDYFNKSMFIIKDSGKTQYLLNPGINLNKHIKIKCSTETGDTLESSKQFDQDSKVRGHSDWTLTRAGVEEIKRNFIPANDIIDLIKDKDYFTVEQIIENKALDSTVKKQLTERVKDLEKDEKVTPELKSFNNIIELIQNIKVRKTISGNRTTYSLVTSTSKALEDKEEDFLTRIKTEIFNWKISNEDRWIKAIIKGINKVVKKFNKST